MLLYVGPSQLIPLSGFIGTVAGLAMMYWGKIVHMARGLGSMVRGHKTDEKDNPPRNPQPANQSQAPGLVPHRGEDE